MFKINIDRLVESSTSSEFKNVLDLMVFTSYLIYIYMTYIFFSKYLINENEIMILIFR